MAFVTNRVRRFPGIAAIVDIENFTPFCSAPGSDSKLPEYLNFVFELVADGFEGAKLAPPFYWKFLGDGALYVWDLSDDPKHRETAAAVVLACHHLFRMFPASVADIAEDIAAMHLPMRIRAGIAQGDLLELVPDSSDSYIKERECVGFAINMAARLQKYCPGIGFLVSTSVQLSEEFVEEYGFQKAQTKTIKGMRSVDEWVRFTAEDASRLSKGEFDKFFKKST